MLAFLHVLKCLSFLLAGYQVLCHCYCYFSVIVHSKIANICWIIEKTGEFQRNIYFCFIDYTKAFDCVDHNKLWKILKVMETPDHLTCLERNPCAGQEATVRTRYGKMDWFQIRKGIHQGCILSPVYLIYMQSTSCEMPGCMKHKLKSRLWGEISITSDMQMTPPNSRMQRGIKEPRGEVEGGVKTLA